MHRENRIIWVFVYAIALHGLWGLMLLFYSSPLQVSSISTLGDVIPNHWVLGSALIVIAAMATVTMIGHHPPWRFGLLIAPQQTALFISAIGSVWLVWLRHYNAVKDLSQYGFTHQQIVFLAPLYHRFTDPRILLASQIPTILAALCHMGAICKHYKDGE